MEDCFPTHLADNLQYAGKTESLFVDAGFRLLHSSPDRRPMVFQKTLLSDRSRFDSLKAETYPVQRVINRIGRKIVSQIRF